MLFLKRTITAIGCFFPLAIILFLFSSILLASIAGAIAGSETDNVSDGFEAGKKVGEEIGKNYGSLILPFKAVALTFPYTFEVVAEDPEEDTCVIYFPDT
jgi:hypothetical protein